MGQVIKLTASDGFKQGAYRADPAGTPKAAIVVIQEIFGVNHHIRAVCDRLAAAGYIAIAPSIFDRIEPNFQCGYSPDEVANARKFVANPDWAAMLLDTQAAIDAVRSVGPVGIIGFCLGGSIAYAAATKLSGLSAAVGYYGGAVVRFADDKPKVRSRLHHEDVLHCSLAADGGQFPARLRATTAAGRRPLSAALHRDPVEHHVAGLGHG